MRIQILNLNILFQHTVATHTTIKTILSLLKKVYLKPELFNSFKVAWMKGIHDTYLNWYPCKLIKNFQ